MYKKIIDLLNKIKKYRKVCYFSDGTSFIRENKDFIIYFESSKSIRIYKEIWMDGSIAIDDNFTWNDGIKLNESEKMQLMEKIKLIFPKNKIISL